MFDGFHSAIVGVDGSPESLAALDQARQLLTEGGAITAVTVCEERLAVHTGHNAPRIAEDMHAAALSILAEAEAALAGATAAETRVLHEKPMQGLLAAAQEVRADLLVVGSHGHSRAAAIMIGSVAGEILHHAHETVLVARPSRRKRIASIVVGVDGSPASLGALAVASELAARKGARLLTVAADGGKGVDPVVLAEVPGIERRPGNHPVDVLVEAAEDADLIVVGSRGLHGIASLGSVSERVAHHARCSVLVVRGTALTRALVGELVRAGAVGAR